MINKFNILKFKLKCQKFCKKKKNYFLCYYYWIFMLYGMLDWDEKQFEIKTENFK